MPTLLNAPDCFLDEGTDGKTLLALLVGTTGAGLTTGVEKLEIGAALGSTVLFSIGISVAPFGLGLDSVAVEPFGTENRLFSSSMTLIPLMPLPVAVPFDTEDADDEDVEAVVAAEAAAEGAGNFGGGRDGRDGFDD